MLIKNNFNSMNYSPFINEGEMNSTNTRVRIAVEFLDSCQFDCAGCFVKRRNEYSEHDLDILLSAVDMFKAQGMDFDEVILGPTDFFSATNTIATLTNPKFKKIFENGDVVLTVLSTLQDTEEHILDVIKVVNEHYTHPNMEMEFLIPFNIQRVVNQDIMYVSEVQRKIQLLDQLKPAVDYAMQLNIHDVDKMVDGFSLPKMTKFIRQNFQTIVEFNPSFMRARKAHIVKKVLAEWNTTLETHVKELHAQDITFTMVNQYHASFNETTYTYKDGHLYICPFIYENVVDLGPEFKIPKASDFYTIDDINSIDTKIIADQYEFASESECGDCEYLGSCVGKKAVYYMKQYNMRECIISKKLMAYYEGTL